MTAQIQARRERPSIRLSLPVFTPPAVPPASLPRRVALVAAAGLAWLLLYAILPTAAGWITHGPVGLPPTGHLSEAVEFFTYDVPKVFLLLVAVVFAVGIIHTFVTPERTRRLLAGRRVGGRLPARGRARRRDAVLLVLGGAALHRLRRSGRAAGRHVFVSRRSAHGQRGRARPALGLFGWKIACLYLVDRPRGRHDRRSRHRAARPGGSVEE